MITMDRDTGLRTFSPTQCMEPGYFAQVNPATQGIVVLERRVPTETSVF